jgi:hypothetical protein
MRTRTSGGVGGAGVSPAPTQSVNASGSTTNGGLGFLDPDSVLHRTSSRAAGWRRDLLESAQQHPALRGSGPQFNPG